MNLAVLPEGKQTVIACLAKGKQLARPVFTAVVCRREGGRRRQFAMMAAQGLDVLWMLAFVSLFDFFAAATTLRNGTLRLS